MAHYRTTARTPWSADDAYRFMSNLTRFPEWDPGIKTAKLINGEIGEVGSTYDLEVSGTVMRYEIESADPPLRLEARSQTKLLDAVDVITVDGAEDGATVTYEADLELRGLLRIGDPLLSLMFKRIGDRAAAGLRDRLQKPL